MKAAKTHVTPHVFVADPDLPADHRGLYTCRRCHLVGKPGDAHHAMPEPELDVQQLRAGENGGEA